VTRDEGTGPSAGAILFRRPADDTSAIGQAPVLATEGLTKRFPGVVAVSSVDLELHGGRIVALLGPNGAGKSTFIQILAGVHASGTYEGRLRMGGAPYGPASVLDAERAGVVLIPQEVNVVPDMTVGQNMFLNHEPTRFGLLDTPALYARARAELEEFGIGIPPTARMGDLDLASQQLVVIARALAKRARLLILDEPTAALTEGETQRLFEHLYTLRDRGVAIVFVSHRLSEVFAIADRILVMRDGRLTGDHAVADVTRDHVIAEMVGALGSTGVRRSRTLGDVVLDVRALSVHDPQEADRERVSDATIGVRAGEIVGLFGLVGAGCSQLVQAVFGAWPGAVRGSIWLLGAPYRPSTPSAAVEAGMGLMSQDRRESLVADASIADNIILASLSAVTRLGFLDVERKRSVAKEKLVALHIRAPSIDATVRSLSGGNQQKVQVARWLTAGTRVLLLDDPTRGVDVGARAEIHALLTDLAANGCGLLWVSSDAEELVDVADRIVVMRQGRVVGEIPASEASEERLIGEAAGV
jgi:ABC-type sugar transport system ATPase subunit